MRPVALTTLVALVSAATVPVDAVAQTANPLAAIPRIRLITHDQDQVLAVIRVIRAAQVPDRTRANGVPFAAGWLWPVRGRLSSGFGMRRHPITQDRRFHAGIDLAAPLGTPVRAAADGQVRVTGRRGGYGRFVELDHGQGWTTRYGHLQQARVTPGQRVAAGEIIATAGSTGLSTGPHLHFEMRRHGRPVDPMTRLTGKAGQRVVLRPPSSPGVDG